MARKKTQIQAEEEAFSIGLELCVEYKSDGEKHKYLCKKCCHVFDGRPTHVRRGHGCPQCAGHVKTQKQAEEDALSLNLKLLSIYLNAKSRLKYLCLTCSYEFEAVSNNIQQGRGCPECANKSRIIKNTIHKNPNCSYIARLLRNRFKYVVKRIGAIKQASAIDSLGCTLDEFVVYFEKLFQPGMTWENHGEWHVDHIRPLSSFDLELKEEQERACHYSNLQPLWALDNKRKGAKYEATKI